MSTKDLPSFSMMVSLKVSKAHFSKETAHPFKPKYHDDITLNIVGPVRKGAEQKFKEYKRENEVGAEIFYELKMHHCVC